MVSAEAFSELLQMLYSAPLDAIHWERFLSLLTRQTEGRFGVFICADSGQGLSVQAFGGEIGLESIQRYNQRYARTDPFRLGLIRQNRIGVFHGDDVVPAEAFLQTDLYRNGLGPFGVRYVTLVPLTLSVRRFEAVSIWRAPEDGCMHADGVRLLELLLPHLRQALEIHRKLDVTQHRLAGAEAIADASATATLLITRQGTVLHTNAAARSLLERESATLALSDGILTARDSLLRTRMKDFFLGITLSSRPILDKKQVTALALPRSSSPQPLQMIASPLPLDRRSGEPAELLVLITDPDKSASCPDDALRTLYRLTHAETEVANALLMGYNLDEIADLRRCRVGTVRSQIKSILGKTRTGRQSDLVRLLMTVPQPPR
jgi:DNA-binding CsgD family transcriptional regulator/PAS domain-containing protein